MEFKIFINDIFKVSFTDYNDAMEYAENVPLGKKVEIIKHKN